MMFIFTHSSSCVLPRYCENYFRSFHTPQECAAYIVTCSTLWTRFPAQKHQLIRDWALWFCFPFIFPASRAAKLSPELYYQWKYIKVWKYILLPPLDTLSQLFVVFISKNYKLLQKERNESIYFIKQTEYGRD